MKASASSAPHDRRPDRAERQPHRPARAVHDEARTRDRDHHCIAHPDLGVALPAIEHRNVDLGHELAWAERRALHPDHELSDRHGATTCDRLQYHRQRRARLSTGRPFGRRRIVKQVAEVAADRARFGGIPCCCCCLFCVLCFWFCVFWFLFWVWRLFGRFGLFCYWLLGIILVLGLFLCFLFLGWPPVFCGCLSFILWVLCLCCLYFGLLVCLLVCF
jgi:hypothetical protein